MRKRRILWTAIVAALLAWAGSPAHGSNARLPVESQVLLAPSLWAPPANSPLALGQHPRLYVTPGELPALREKIATYYRQDFRGFVEALDADFSKAPSFFQEDDVFAYGRGYAFLSLLDPNSIPGALPAHSPKEYADKAVEFALHYGAMSGFSDSHSAANGPGLIMLALGTIYDWTHSHTTPSQKQAVADVLISRFDAREADVRPPYGGKPGIENHKGIYAHDVVFPALALWGDPQLTAAQRSAAEAALEDFYQVLLVRQLDAGSSAFANALGRPSTGSPEGDGYADDVYSALMYAAGAASSALGENLFFTKSYLRDMPYFLYAYTIPFKVDGQYQLDKQDTSTMEPVSDNHSRLMIGAAWHLRDLDPDRAAFAAWWVHVSPYGFEPNEFKYYTPVRYDLFFKFLWGTKPITPKDPSSAGVPLTLRLGGFDVFRSSHDSEGASRLLFWDTTYWYPNGHQEDEMSSINLQKYGTLLVDYVNTKSSGDDIPKCDEGKGPIVDNLLSVPSDSFMHFPMGSTEPGSGDPMPDWFYPGSPAQVGANLAVDSLPGEYDYVHYDYTRSYKGGDQVRQAHRQLLYLRGPENQEYLVLHEYLESGAEKRWVARMPYDIHLLDGSWSAVNGYHWTGGGTVLSMTNRYQDVAHGQLFIKSVLPTNAALHKLGGPQAPYIDANDQPFCSGFGGRTYGERAKYWTGQYRLEIRSSEPEFLTVLQFGDANTLKAMDPVSRISAGPAEGVLVRDRLVLFSKNPGGAPLETLQYTLASTGHTRHLVVNVVPNAAYEVTLNASKFEVQSSDQGTIYFQDQATGSHTVLIRKTGSGSTPTFRDVPINHWANGHVEALYRGGFVAGCATDPLRYCPEGAMTRGEMAVFVERGVHGGGYLPAQPSEQVFADVPLTQWFAKWSDALWRDRYTAGCGTAPLIFCPLAQHIRAEATVYFERMLNGPDYTPPAPTQRSFDDVAPDTWYAKWVEAAQQDGLLLECEDPANRRDRLFRPEAGLTRAEAACMMAKAKGLSSP